MIEYKYNEENLLNELKAYIDDTYNEHYSMEKIQSTEFIMDAGHGMGFTLGNVIKYSQRYGKKDGYNRKDLLKILHYALMALNCHDIEHPQVEDFDIIFDTSFEGIDTWEDFDNINGYGSVSVSN